MDLRSRQIKNLQITNLRILWLLFFIWPFGSFIIAISKGFNKSYQKIILAFAFLFGYGVYLYSGDVLDYESSFYAISNISWQDFWYLLVNRFNTDNLSKYSELRIFNKPDFFALILQFLISRISNSPRLFWAVLSLIYTFFNLLFFNEIFKSIKHTKKTLPHYVFILFLILCVPFYVGVTGVRFWPALFLFMYFLMKYIDNQDIKYILYSGTTILFHYSFVVPVIILLIFHFVPIKKVTGRIILLISILFFILSSTSDMFNMLNRTVQRFDDTTFAEQSESYFDEDIYQQNILKQQETNWYVSLRSDSLFYVLVAFSLLEFFNIIKFKNTDLSLKMYPYLLLFFCLTILTSHLGSIGRFKNIFYLMALARYVMIFPLNMNNLAMKLLTLVLTPTLLLYIAVTFRSGFYYVEPYLLINNSVGIFFMRASESLSEFIVGH